MKRKVVPIYNLGDHCLTGDVNTLEISPFSDTSCTASEFGPHHRHHYYEIIWLKNGSGIHHIDTTSYPYSGSVLFLLSPGQIHQLQQSEKAEGYVVRFLPAIFGDVKNVTDFILNTQLFENVQASPLLKVPAPQFSVIDDLFLKISIEFNGYQKDKEPMLGAYLKILMMQIARLKHQQEIIQQHEMDAGFALFRNYKIAIEKYYTSTHLVQGYADLLHMQPRMLNTVARKYSGKSAGELITERILLEAKRYLYHNLESVKEIAFALGFEDPAYFTRLFKKHTGLSPVEYRLNATGTGIGSSRTA
jgi:AraC family transcriptional regulator, transcriptional activator of pobA